MKITPISSQSNPAAVSLSANAPGVRSPVFVLTIPPGATYTLKNGTLIRGQMLTGAAFIVKLIDASGVPIRGKLTLAAKAQADETETNIRTMPLTIWSDLTTAQQRSEDYKGTLIAQTDLNVPSIEFNQQSQLIFLVESSQAVDWTKSYLEFNVEERN